MSTVALSLISFYAIPYAYSLAHSLKDRLKDVSRIAITAIEETSQMRASTAKEIRASNLEITHLPLVTALDLTQPCHFRDFLTPNETLPIEAREHLTMSSPGLIVSTGGVRSLFDLCLADPEMCTGLVIRDINPKIKAYMDFEILLIRLAGDSAQYRHLAAPQERSFVNTPSYPAKLREIKQLLEQSDLSAELKHYYLLHLEEMAKIYFEHQYRDGECWKTTDSFDGVNYYKDETLFKKVQNYARAGKIITTVGPIDDLQFLRGARVGVVDISNIPNYVLLDFKVLSPPEKILWTYLHEGRTTYQSASMTLLTADEMEECKGLVQDLIRRYPDYVDAPQELLCNLFARKSMLGTLDHLMPPIYYCQEFLNALRKERKVYQMLQKALMNTTIRTLYEQANATATFKQGRMCDDPWIIKEDASLENSGNCDYLSRMILLHPSLSEEEAISRLIFELMHAIYYPKFSALDKRFSNGHIDQQEYVHERKKIEAEIELQYQHIVTQAL